MSENVLENRLEPLMKYPGGKEKELVHIIPALPKRFDNYYEPFVGGGAVFFSIKAGKYFINDKSDELISLYEMVKTQNGGFFDRLTDIGAGWDAVGGFVEKHREALTNLYSSYKSGEWDKKQLEREITAFAEKYAAELAALLAGDVRRAEAEFAGEVRASLKNKIVRMKKISEEKGELPYEDVAANIESAFKAAFYTHARMLMNGAKELGINREFATALYFFIRQTCYSSMFRYNKEGKFNVPYGGISYNKKSLAGKISYFRDRELAGHLAKTTIGNMDFYEFMETYKPAENDFVFLDPPYDSEFSTYAKNEFGREDQARLAAYLLCECRADFMLVIRNTDYIASLYPAGERTANGKRLKVAMFDKRYFVSFQDRNNKEAQHLLITNYDFENNLPIICK